MKSYIALLYDTFASDRDVDRLISITGRELASGSGEFPYGSILYLCIINVKGRQLNLKRIYPRGETD